MQRRRRLVGPARSVGLARPSPREFPITDLDCPGCGFHILRFSCLRPSHTRALLASPIGLPIEYL